MENKFDINSEEVKRILSLHEDATKNQYLNVISEVDGSDSQSSQNKTIKYDVGVYTGEIKNNKPEGKGTMKYENGEIYSGYWKNGKYEGKGIYKWIDGDYYSGDWRNGKREGKGIYKWTDGTYYLGDYKNGKREGKGTYQNTLNVKFYGDWEGNNFNCNGKKLGWVYLDGFKTNPCNPQQQVQQGQQQTTQPKQQLTPQRIQQQKTQPTQQQFIQQVTTNNKLIQTSLGVQQPTGQLTTADIDAIITKLG